MPFSFFGEAITLPILTTKNHTMKPHLEEKHRKLREEYKALFNKGLRSEVIIEQLAAKYFYSKNTTGAIIWQTAHYHKPKSKKPKVNKP